MKTYLKGCFIFAVLLSAALAGAQTSTQIDPATRINWPRITGAGTPTGLGIACGSANYGQPFQNTAVTPNVSYSCGTDGWESRPTTGVILQTSGANNASQALLNAVGGNGIMVANTSGGNVIISQAPLFAIDSFTCSTCATVEIGATIASPTDFTSSYSSTPASAGISDGTNTDNLTTPFTSGSFAFPYMLTAAGSVCYTLTAVGPTTQTSQLCSYWEPRTFSGPGTAGATGATASGTDADLAGATGTLASAGLNNQGSYGCTASGQKCYVLMVGGSHTFTSGGFSFPMNSPTSVAFVNQYGTTVAEELYESVNSIGASGAPISLTLQVAN